MLNRIILASTKREPFVNTIIGLFIIRIRPILYTWCILLTASPDKARWQVGVVERDLSAEAPVPTVHKAEHPLRRS